MASYPCLLEFTVSDKLMNWVSDYVNRLEPAWRHQTPSNIKLRAVSMSIYIFPGYCAPLRGRIAPGRDKLDRREALSQLLWQQVAEAVCRHRELISTPRTGGGKRDRQVAAGAQRAREDLRRRVE